MFIHWINPFLHLTGNPITAVYAISANRPGYSDYFVMSPPSSYRSPSWMSYPPEPEDLPRQWNDTPVRHIVFSYWASLWCRFIRDELRTLLLFSLQNSRHLETICWIICLWHGVETHDCLVGLTPLYASSHVYDFIFNGITETHHHVCFHTQSLNTLL